MLGGTRGLLPRLVVLLALVARARAVDNAVCATSSDGGVDWFPPATRLSAGATAGGSTRAIYDVGAAFNVSYAKTFKVVRTKALVGGALAAEKTYVLHQCGTPRPTVDVDGSSAFPSDAQFFSVPVRAVATSMTVAVGYLEQLGARDALKMTDPAYVHSPCVQRDEENGVIVASHIEYNSDWSENRTLWRNALNGISGLDMVITDHYDGGTGSSGTAKDVAFHASDADLDMLQRTEQIKFLSLFFNKEAEANAYYADQVERWNYMSSLIASAQSQGRLRSGLKCAWVTASGGSYTVSWAKYKDDICTAAGLTTYAQSGVSGTSHTFPSTEAYLTAMAGVSIVIDESYFYNPSTSATKTAVHANLGFTGRTLPSMNSATGMILRLDKHVSDGDPLYAPAGYYPSEGMAWFEDPYVHPALVLADFAQLVWFSSFGIEAIRAGCPRFFRNVNSDDGVIKTTASDCDVWENARINQLCLIQLSQQRVTLAALFSLPGSSSSAAPVSRIALTLVVFAATVMAFLT